MIIFEFAHNDFLTSIIHFDDSRIGFIDGTYIRHNSYVLKLAKDSSLDSYIYGL